MIATDLLLALKPVVNVFEELKISYVVGGSIASSVYGIARSTLDADLMADIKLAHIAPLVAGLKDSYYISELAIQESLARHSSFNLIHLATIVKVDIFIPKENLFDQIIMTRKKERPIDDVDPHLFQLTSAEDIILLKLDWFRQANGQSEKQWSDIWGVLRVQKDRLDQTYLAEWANRLGLTDLLNKAFSDAGIVS